MIKRKITEEGQKCRKCYAAVRWVGHTPDWKPKPKQRTYFMRWLECTGCGEIYYLESERTYIPLTSEDPQPEIPGLFDQLERFN